MHTAKVYLIMGLVLISVIALSGCLSSKHFQKDGISFDYPSNWKIGEIYDLPGAVVGVSESSQVDVKIFKKQIPTDSSLKEVYYTSIANHSTTLEKYCYQQISNKTIAIDSTIGYDTVFQIGCNSTQTRQKIREVWLERNGYIYIIQCTVIPPEIFPSKNAAFDEIINSFHVKQTTL